MIALLILLIPLLGGIFSFVAGANRKLVSLIFTSSAALLLTTVVLALTCWNQPPLSVFSAPWLQGVGSSFSLVLDPLASVLCLLNALVYFLLALYMLQKPIEKSAAFDAGVQCQCQKSVGQGVVASHIAAAPAVQECVECLFAVWPFGGEWLEVVGARG